jgi:crotonobetainyl-CoA:carnitine CoA-transferase CaiB-like acyl-CoA transferase
MGQAPNHRWHRIHGGTRPQAGRLGAQSTASPREVLMKATRILVLVVLWGAQSGVALAADAVEIEHEVVSYWARSGLSITRFPIDGWLGPIPFGAGDHPSSLGLFGGIMLALYRRQSTGVGTKVAHSLIATGAWANASTIAARLVDAEFPEPWRRDEGPGIGAVFFKSSDLRPFQIGYADESKWQPVCRAVGRTDLIDDPRFATAELRKAHGPELIAEFDTAFEHRAVNFQRS